MVGLLVAGWGAIRAPLDWARIAKRRAAGWALAASLAAIMVACGHAGPASQTPSVEPTPATAPTPSAGPSPTTSASPTGSPAPQGVPLGAQLATVAKVVDGDTIWVTVDQPGGPLPPAATHKIRLLEYDSPEATSKLECFGPEASQALSGFVPVGSPVWLVADRENTDRYGRFLRYLWSSSGVFVNLEMVRGGFGEAVLYQPNDRYIDEMRAVEAEAKAAKRGMWGPPCDYDASVPGPAPKSAPRTSTQPPKGDGGPYFASCNQAKAAGAAPLYRGQPGYRPELDGDRDGVACEG